MNTQNKIQRPSLDSDNRTEQERRDDERLHDRMIEYVKHLTTLSTGSIVLQVAFLEKVFPHPQWRALIVISLCAFGISVLGSVVAYWLLMNELRTYTETQAYRLAGSFIVIWASFLIGIVALGAFGIRNVIAP